MTIGPLIEAEQLAEHLHDPSWVSVDCRFNLLEPNAGYGDYRRAHIPGARYAHLDHDLARAPGPDEGRHPLPSPQTFAKRLGDWGIRNDSTVVAYDEGGAAIAARLWWMVRWLGHARVAVLNGGFRAWLAAACPVQSEVPSWQPAQYVPREIKSGWIASTADVAAAASDRGLVIDVRAPQRYRGEQEPIDPVAGHIPGACNWPFSTSLEPDGRWRMADQIREDLGAVLAGRDADRVIAMCGSGVTACHLLLAMQVAGLEGARLYEGSWSEWIRDPTRPIRTGSEP